MKFLSVDEQLEKIRWGAADLLVEADLRKKLARNKPLKIKFGADPSRPDLHIGHTVVINKMRTFQELGHEVIFLIGDFTGLIGDPSGRNQTRPLLTVDEIKENAKTYSEQIFKILDPEKTTIAFNSEWINKLTSVDWIKLAASSTVAQMLEREDFSKRYQNKAPISLHEFLYPLVQAYDSVALKADVELGGTDQTFNLLKGRELQTHLGQEAQVVLTMPLLEGIDGVQKMSKSYDNYISLIDVPRDMFGKVMRISDELMIRYYHLLTDLKPKLGDEHPRELKVKLAHLLVERFHSKSVADNAVDEFNRMFQQGGLPDDIEVRDFAAGTYVADALLADLNLATSKSDAQRLIKGSACEISGNKVSDFKAKIELKSGEEVLIRVGKKRFIKLKVK